MISKVVAADSFYHTCRYITNKQGAEVLDVAGVRGHSYKLMAEDFVFQQEMRPSKERACFHGILSFYPGEKPSDNTMKEIARKYLEGLGIVNTQYAISKHTDKDHLHMHIVANMVNNDGKSIRDSYIGLRGKKVAQRLTQEYKLIPALEKNLKLTHLENLSDTEANKYKIYIAISQMLPLCLNMQELEACLLKQGIEIQYKYKGQTDVKQGISFKIGNFCFKGSQVDRKFSFAGLEKAFSQKQHIYLEHKTDLEEIDETQNKPKKQDQLPGKSLKSEVLSVKIKSKASENLEGNGVGNEFAKGVGKVLEDLLQPEHTNDNLPYEFTREGYLRNQKKKKRQNKLK